MKFKLLLNVVCVLVYSYLKKQNKVLQLLLKLTVLNEQMITSLIDHRHLESINISCWWTLSHCRLFQLERCFQHTCLTCKTVYLWLFKRDFHSDQKQTAAWESEITQRSFSSASVLWEVKLQKTEAVVGDVWVQDVTRTYWSGWVFPEGSSSDRRRCGSKFPFPPLERDASSAHTQEVKSTFLLLPLSLHVVIKSFYSRFQQNSVLLETTRLHHLSCSSNKLSISSHCCRESHWTDVSMILRAELTSVLIHLYLSGLQQLVKADDDQQPEAWQEDVHEDPEEKRNKRRFNKEHKSKYGTEKMLITLTSLRPGRPLAQWWWPSGWTRRPGRRFPAEGKRDVETRWREEEKDESEEKAGERWESGDKIR